MRHTSRRCQRSNRQLDDPSASTYKLDLTVRTNGATSVDWRVLPKQVTVEMRELARESDAHELAIVDCWSTNVSDLLRTLHKMGKLCGHLGFKAWNLAVMIRSSAGLPAARWLESEWESLDLLHAMSLAYAFKGDPDDEFELNPENQIGGGPAVGRKVATLAAANSEQNRLH